MNSYKILSKNGAGELTSYVTAIDEKDARRIFKRQDNGKDMEIASVTLYRENVPATKAQERDALERIRAIVAPLGPRSYVGTALEGCLEDAEVNIENDFGDSMKARWQAAERRVAEAVKETAAVKEELAQAQNALRDAENDVDHLARKVISDDDLTDVEQLVAFHISELQERVKAEEAAILANAEHPEIEAFRDAVRARKALAGDIEYYKALGLRLAATRGQ